MSPPAAVGLLKVVMVPRLVLVLVGPGLMYVAAAAAAAAAAEEVVVESFIIGVRLSHLI